MTNQFEQNQVEQQLRQQQAGQNVSQVNAQNARTHAEQLSQLVNAQANQPTTYKVIASFRDAHDNLKEYQVGDTYECSDVKRIQELLAAHVIAEEIPQVELQTTDPALAARQETRKQEAKAAEQKAKTKAQNKQGSQAAQVQAAQTQAQAAQTQAAETSHIKSRKAKEAGE